jgi:heterodisulfide reductase subunit C
MAVQLDPVFKKKIASLPGGENMMNCFLCGTCTAGCPVSALDGAYSPRTIMRLALLGAKDELLALPELWECSQCHICVAHCPQDARPADVIRVLRGLAVTEGVVAADKAERFAALEDEIKVLRLERIKKAIEEG